jgi:hypothetical protein
MELQMKDCGLRKCHTCACQGCHRFYAKKILSADVDTLDEVTYSFKEAKSSQSLSLDTYET